MNRRLQQFLVLENLTPARLADIIDVQRSSISHILSGRNKPSYDFIQKLLLKFPTLSAEWLLTGKGKPHKETVSYEGDTLFPDNEPLNTDFEENQLPEISIFEDEPATSTEKRQVKRITLFYRDGSFEDFFPNK